MKLSNKKCFLGLVNGKTYVSANSFTQLKRLASRRANNDFNSIDTLRLTIEENGCNIAILNFTRINRKSPNNTIIYGAWK